VGKHFSLSGSTGAAVFCRYDVLRLIPLERLYFAKLCQNVDGFVLAN